MSLIHEYIKLFNSNREAVDQLNETFNTNVSVQRLSEWARKDSARPLPTRIAEPMRALILPLILEDEGVKVSPETLANIIDKLSLINYQ